MTLWLCARGWPVACRRAPDGLLSSLGPCCLPAPLPSRKGSRAKQFLGRAVRAGPPGCVAAAAFPGETFMRPRCAQPAPAHTLGLGKATPSALRSGEKRPLPSHEGLRRRASGRNAARWPSQLDLSTRCASRRVRRTRSGKKTLTLFPKTGGWEGCVEEPGSCGRATMFHCESPSAVEKEALLLPRGLSDGGVIRLWSSN